jgi:hypothetical protein
MLKLLYKLRDVKSIVLSFNSCCLIGLLLISNYTNATKYYVNDGFVANDVYCSVIGNNTNNGLSSSTPKLTLKNLWTTYGPSGTNVLTSGDTILIDAGTYSTTGMASVDEAGFNITVAGLTFLGAHMDLTIFDHNHHGTPTEYFMYINADNVVLKNMTIREFDNNGTVTPAGHSGQAITIGGSAPVKTGILLENVNLIENGLSGGNPALSVLSYCNVTVKGGGSFCNTNGTAYTGGIEAYGTNINLLIQNTILGNNYKVGSFDGGGLRIEGDATTVVVVTNCRIANNIASYGGGISQTNGNLTVTNTIIEGNSAGQVSTTIYGGGYRINAGTARFSNCLFKNNFRASGTLRGGAVSARYTNAGVFTTNKIINLTIDSSIFQGNTGDLGFDIYAANGFSNACNLIVRDCQFLTPGNFNIVSDASSPASSIAVTYFGTLPTSSGSNITKSVSVNPIFTPNPSPPSFTGSCGTIQVLPVELVSFTGECEESLVNLFWSTVTEHNNDYFTLERASEDGVFRDIAFVNGQINSTQLVNYSYTDYNPLLGTSYYRLSQTDVDGVKTEFNILSMNGNCFEQNKEGFTASYNATNSNLLLNYSFQQNEDFYLAVYNALGQIVFSNSVSLKASERMEKIDLRSTLQTGIYFVTLSNEQKNLSEKIMVFNK